MPYGDGTCPIGEGPMSGRGLGNCNTNKDGSDKQYPAGQKNNTGRGGLGMGRCANVGKGFGSRPGCGRGMCGRGMGKRK